MFGRLKFDQKNQEEQKRQLFSLQKRLGFHAILNRTKDIFGRFFHEENPDEGLWPHPRALRKVK